MNKFNIAVICPQDSDLEESDVLLAWTAFANSSKEKHQNGIGFNFFWSEMTPKLINAVRKMGVDWTIYASGNRSIAWETMNLAGTSKIVSSPERGWLFDRLLEDSSMACFFHSFKCYDDELFMIESMKNAHTYTVQPLQQYYGDKYISYEDAKASNHWIDKVHDIAEEAQP